MKRRLASFVAAVSLLGTGCGVSFDTELMASIEGRWMCDVQRHTFADTTDIQAELDARLAGNGVTADQYRAFKDALTKQPELRDQVRTVYDGYCDTGA